MANQYISRIVQSDIVYLYVSEPGYNAKSGML
jgi:hypothetical protein